MKIPYFIEALGPDGVLISEADKAPYMQEWRGRMMGKAACVLLPRTTEEVAKIVHICADAKIVIVPQGGNTGLVGASVPESTKAVCLSLKRMNKVRVIDAHDYSMVVEAGCILQNAKQAASEKNVALAMTLASEGSATIGGLIATNAGGSFTLRYGNMREQVLGLEAVLPDGRIWNGLKTLHKDNSGYDLKQLLIGSEGTLGIITAASLKLRPQPEKIETAMVALSGPQQALEALAKLRALTHDRMAAFELIPKIAVEAAVTHLGKRKPFQENYEWLALVEAHDSAASLEECLGKLLDKNELLNAVPAKNAGDARAFWDLREGIVEAQKHLGASLKNDLSVPVSAIPALIERGSKIVTSFIPGIRPYLFGHVGDGNIHFNLSQPEGMDKDAFTAQRQAIEYALHDLVLELGGSISAEHGIGRFKREEFHRTAQKVELDALKRIKNAFDPLGIMNPGVMV